MEGRTEKVNLCRLSYQSIGRLFPNSQSSSPSVADFMKDQHKAVRHCKEKSVASIPLIGTEKTPLAMPDFLSIEETNPVTP